MNSFSEEAKNYDFSVGDMDLCGNIRFVTYYFQCPQCDASYEISELKKLHREQKKANKDRDKKG